MGIYSFKDSKPRGTKKHSQDKRSCFLFDKQLQHTSLMLIFQLKSRGKLANHPTHPLPTHYNITFFTYKLQGLRRVKRKITDNKIKLDHKLCLVWVFYPAITNFYPISWIWREWLWLRLGGTEPQERLQRRVQPRKSTVQQKMQKD